MSYVPKSPASSAARILTSARTLRLQRKCACGGNSGLDGECEECKQQRVQRKTAVSHSANQAKAAVPPIVHEVLRSPGKPLDAAMRALMEPRFGHDFGHVRLHTDAQAAESARAVNALAYTLGRDVVFGLGQYSPESANARRLLAHELTHVVQQDTEALGPSRFRIAATETSAEKEARAFSAAPHAGAPRVVEHVPPQLQRDVDDPGRMAAVHKDLFVSAPGTSGGARRPWQDASATDGGTAVEIIRQVKTSDRFEKAAQNLPVNIDLSTTKADLDIDAVAINKRIRKRFPQITTAVSEQQITGAVRVLSPSDTSDPVFLHQWLANKLIGWTDIELYEINETDPRFIAMLDKLLADAEVGVDLHAMASLQLALTQGEGTSHEIAVHPGTPAGQRKLALIHEFVHFYAHPAYVEWVGKTTDKRFYNEGFTEWLARRVMTEAEKTGETSYQDRVEAINRQVAANIPEDDIARAYFGGEVWRIESGSSIAHREFAAAAGIHEGAAQREESSESLSGPGLNEEVEPGVRYRFFNLGNEVAAPKPEHVAFFGTLKSRYVDSDPKVRIRFEGHASTPGPLAYNERLSLQRALAFYSMARTAGVSDTRLLEAQNPAHFGETHPTLTEENAETRAFNRRVEMFLIQVTQPTGDSNE